MNPDQVHSMIQRYTRLIDHTAQCDVAVTCKRDECPKIRYTKEMVAHQMVSGLANPDPQARQIHHTIAVRVDKRSDLSKMQALCLEPQPLGSTTTLIPWSGQPIGMEANESTHFCKIVPNGQSRDNPSNARRRPSYCPIAR